MKIMIVDDEQPIREGLSVMIGRIDSLSPELLSVCSNAEEALDRMIVQPPDVLISDIRMPGMDGIRLAELVKERFPNTDILFLSGHSDFQYLRKAVQLGIGDYLLKPLKQTELAAALKRISLKKRRQSQRNLKWDWDKFAYAEFPWKCIVVGDLDEASSARATEIGGPNTLNWILYQVASEVVEGTSGVCLLRHSMSKSSNMILGVYGETEQAVAGTADAVTRDISSFWKEKIRTSLSFGISEPTSDGMRLYSSLLEACKALFARVTGGPSVRTYREAFLSAAPPAAELKLNLNPLLAYWDTGNHARMTEQLKLLLQEAAGQNNALHILQSTELILLTLQENMRTASGQPVPSTGAEDILILLNDLLWSRNKEQWIASTMDWFSSVLDRAAPHKQEGNVLSHAKSFIRSNLHKPITLSDVAESVYVTPQYLSRVFKEKSGATFMEFLTSLRMEESKRLLKDPTNKIYEVAEMVGYGSWKHFSKTFKDTTGFTPADYRKNLG